MRALQVELEAAQKAASGVPFVRAIVRTAIRGLTHWRPAQAYSGSEPDDQHDAVADGDFLYRCRVRAGTPQLERGLSGSWTPMTAQTDSNVVGMDAVGDARVAVVYNRGAAVYFRESTNQGLSFGAETLVVSTGATPNAIAVAYKNSSGDLAILWEDAATLKRVRRTGGSFGSTASWTQSANSINGLDAVYFSDFLIALTGTDANGRPTVWTLMLGDGAVLGTDTWGRFFVLSQAEADEQVTFQAPFVHPIETYRLTFVEKFSGSPNYTRTYWTVLHAGVTYSPGDWEWMDPAPLDNTTAYGYALAQEPGSPLTAFWARPGRVLKEDLPSSTLDMSADLLEARIDELDGLEQRAELVFDNASGQYAGPPDPIRLHRDVDIGLGYGALYSRPPRQSITGWEFRREGGRSLFVLHTQGAAYWLARSRPRTTIVHSSVAADDITRKAAARAGILLFGASTSSRAQNFNMEWVIHSHQSSLQALEAIGAQMPDLFLSQGGGFSISIHEPKATDATDYDFDSEGHPIYESRTRDEGADSFAEILAVGAVGQAFDFTRLDHDRPLEARRRDPHATLVADADAHASARLRKATLAKDVGELVVPPHVGLEVGDVVAYSDALVSSGQLKARVRSIRTHFRRRQGAPPVYVQRVGLGAV